MRSDESAWCSRVMGGFSLMAVFVHGLCGVDSALRYNCSVFDSTILCSYLIVLFASILY